MPFNVGKDSGPYLGDREKLVICIDVGSTCSAVSYAHLVPGANPKPETVFKWPSSDNELKVPSAIFYKLKPARQSPRFEPVAFCAETEDEVVQVNAEKGGWMLVKDFKLLLHPSNLQNVTVAAAADSLVASAFELPALPDCLQLVQVYMDMYKYLVRHTKEFFCERTLGGAAVWKRLIGAATFVLPHPDSWRDAQQLVLRKALASAGLAESVNSKRVEFVRESEASVHWVLSMQHSTDVLKPGAVFTVVDAGGSTVDTSMLQVETVSPKLQLREVKASDCIQAGGLFVTRAGRKLVQTKLLGSGFDTEEIIDEATRTFETSLKRRFTGNEPSLILKLGVDATLPSIGLRKGRLVLSTRDVEMRCFEYFAGQILQSVERQTRFANLTSTHILLVGGFGESPYLKTRLRDFFKDLNVVITSEPTKKAVSEGGVIYYLKKSVVARAVRLSYGIGVEHRYDADSEEHLSRGYDLDVEGKKVVSGGFSAIIAKNTVVGVDETTILGYQAYMTNKSQFAAYEVDLWAYDSDDVPPEWMLDRYGNQLPGFVRVATIRANLSRLKDFVAARPGLGGVSYRPIDFSVALSFGQNSLKAKLTWDEGGQAQESDAAIVLSVLKDNVSA